MSLLGVDLVGKSLTAPLAAGRIAPPADPTAGAPAPLPAESVQIQGGSPPTPAPAPAPAEDPARVLEQSAQELESAWRQRLGSKAGQETVPVMTTDAWVRDKFVYLQELADAIIAAGGTPRLVFMGRGPVLPQLEGASSLVVPGGGDIDPGFYGQKKLSEGGTDPPYDAFQLQAVRHAIDHKIPMLGLCRGEQLMNVAGGGTLVQDIDSQRADRDHPTAHWNDEAFKDRKLRRFAHHPVSVVQGSRLHEVLGATSAAVNSIHHQCIGNLAPILYVTAWAMDNVPEAVEVKGAPWQVGLQFHPEWLRLDQPRFQGFFDRLVEDGRRYKRGELTRPAPPPTTMTQLE